MPNPIKYTTGSETLALKKGNLYIGTGDVGKGPSDSTGYYQGPSPASGGYVIYLNKSGVPGNLSYHSAANDNQLISFTNNLAATSFTSATQCLNYYATQTDKVCFNRDYEPIVTNGLVLNVDAGFTPSYSRSGTTWTDLSLSGNNGTLTNGPTFNSDNGGSIVFDGTNDYNILNSPTDFNKPSDISFCGWINYLNFNASNSGRAVFKTSNLNENTGFTFYQKTENPYNTVKMYVNTSLGLCILQPTTFLNTSTWYHLSVTYDNTDKLKFYINGELDSSTNAFGPILWPLSARTPIIGVSFNSYFAGNISVIQIYNRTLSSTEISQNYNAQKGRFGL